MTFATLAIGAACWFGPAWTRDSPVRRTAACPYAGHTESGRTLPDASRCSLRRTPVSGDAAVEGDVEVVGGRWPRAAGIAVTTSGPARGGVGTPRGGICGWLLWGMAPFKAGPCCR